MAQLKKCKYCGEYRPSLTKIGPVFTSNSNTMKVTWAIACPNCGYSIRRDQTYKVVNATQNVWSDPAVTSNYFAISGMNSDDARSKLIQLWGTE
jgi:DNA-directed RNA polymerase subunit RPC12/RpoP